MYVSLALFNSYFILFSIFLFVFLHVLLKAASKVKPKKSCGLDGIPMMVIRDTIFSYGDVYLAL